MAPPVLSCQRTCVGCACGGERSVFIRHPELIYSLKEFFVNGVHVYFIIQDLLVCNMVTALFFSFCLDTKRNKKIKTNPMAPPVLSCRRTGGGWASTGSA
jgi:hypothetical protein